MEDNKKTKLYILIGVSIVAVLTILFSIPFIRFVNDPQKLRDWIESLGVFAPLSFILLSMIQVVIPFIPGEPFELLAGYSFGSIKGTILCLLSGSIASFIIILLVKKYGTKLIHNFFSEKELEKLKFLKSKKSFVLYSIIFIMPGTPKDLLCYIGGLNDYELIPLLIVTSFGRLPGIITSTIPGDAIGDKKYMFALIIYSVTAIICLVGLTIYNKIITRSNDE